MNNAVYILSQLFKICKFIQIQSGRAKKISENEATLPQNQTNLLSVSAVPLTVQNLGKLIFVFLKIIIYYLKIIFKLQLTFNIILY